MYSEFPYTIICVKDFAQTVSFYEDYLDFEPVFEMDHFTVLKRNDWDNMYLAIMATDHEDLPAQYRKTPAGMIINYPVLCADKAYKTLYDEGVNIVSDPQTAICGRKHFFVEDPNGVLINLAEKIDLDALMTPEEIADNCHITG